MKGIRGSVCVIAVLAVLVLAAACGDDGDVTSPPGSVVLAAGSWGTAGNGIITGLASGGIYMVETGGEIKGVKDDGTLGNQGEAAALSGTAITGLTNSVTYDVYKVVTGATGGTTALGTSYNTVIDISGLVDTNTHTVAAGSSKPPAQYVIVNVGQALESTSGAGIASQQIEGATLDYTFGTTTADNAVFLDISAGDEWIVLDLSGLTGSSFTTTITVKTAD